MKKRLAAFVISVLLWGLFLVSFSAAQNNQPNIISSDTTWTKANSPYTFSSPVTINGGATLTLEPGVTVNMGSGVYLQVDGTLVAKGTNDDNIFFNGGKIIITQNSPAWNQQTLKGTVIEDTVVSSASIIVSSSAKINNNTINGVEPSCFDGTLVVAGGAPLISHNYIKGGGYPRPIFIGGGSPTINDNYLIGGIFSNSSARRSTISNNTIFGPVMIAGGTPVISHNTITGRRIEYLSGNGSTLGGAASEEVSGGIGMTGYNFGEDKLYDAIVTDNTIIGGLDGIGWNAGPGAIIQNNLITNFTREGLSLGSNAVIQNNTIVNNTIGVNIYNFNGIAGIGDAQSLPSILNNNIMNNSQYNIYSYCGANLTAAYNWWGTADEAAIEKTIYDNTFEPNLGKITVVPYLTQLNPEAYPSESEEPINILPTPTQTPNNQTATPTPPTPTQTPNPNYFTIESNSTVSALSFNGTSSEITFTVSGPNGTMGYVKAAISKDFMPNGDNIKVYLDGNLVSSQVTSNETSWIISFTYHHSTHQVRISQTQNPTTLPISMATIIFATVLILIVLIPVLCIIIWITKETKNKKAL